MSQSAGSTSEETAERRKPGSVIEVFWVALRLGLTSFGGPIAHLGYFHSEYVRRRKWIDEQAYADLVALCQFLPGPASSQVGIAIGIGRAGLLGGVAAWLGFTLPSAAALTAFAYGMRAFAANSDAGWLHGLKIVAVAVVAQAVWAMARVLCPDRARATIAITAAIVTLSWPTALGQILSIALAAAVGLMIFPVTVEKPMVRGRRFALSRQTAIIGWIIFFALLAGLPLLRQLQSTHALEVFDSFFRVGSLVFGGGHVVLPMLRAEVVGPGWVTPEQFVAGYGMTQAVPGPLFTFAAYLGAVMAYEPNGAPGALLALGAIFLPSFLLIAGALPFWDVLREMPAFQSALKGINAAVVGLLLAALYNPVWTSAIISPVDFSLALCAFGLLVFWNCPPWLAVISAAVGAEAISRI
jgi:chromate transporter